MDRGHISRWGFPAIIFSTGLLMLLSGSAPNILYIERLGGIISWSLPILLIVIGIIFLIVEYMNFALRMVALVPFIWLSINQVLYIFTTPRALMISLPIWIYAILSMIGHYFLWDVKKNGQ
jgi:hypothetical protein